MRSFVLGVDLDGVVSDFINDLRPHAAEWLGKPVAELTTDVDYEFEKWGVNQTPGGYPALHKFAVVHRGLFTHSKPVEGAPQVLRELSHAEVYIRIITARICIKWHHAEIVKQTVDWLEHHGIPYWDICFVKDKRTVDADMYIDDSPSNIIKLREAGKKVITFDSSVNRGVPGLRAASWKDVQRIVMEEKMRNGGPR